MTSVGVFGAAGRMGSTSVGALEAADGIEVVAQIDVGDDPQEVLRSGAEVALVFSTPDAATEQVRLCIENGIHVVVGTSGFGESALGEIEDLLGGTPDVGVIVVPNFSIGAVLLMSFAQKAAPFFESVEVIEMHHPNKVDAPSGTAVRTAELIAQARQAADCPPIPDATEIDPDGARGANVKGVPIHAVRARGFVASQEVILGGEGELMSLRHDSTDRESFMPGVIAAVRAVAWRPGLTVGLDEILGIG